MPDKHRRFAGSGTLLILLLMVGVIVIGCRRQADSVQGIAPRPELVKLTAADIDLLRQEVRKQTEHLRAIADDLESYVRSGSSVDRELLLRIESQVNSARSRVERIEVLLERVESASR
ncbi:MAG: hypothetical protein AAEJ65_03515 [Planctomycetota bacterium]|jgi:hypothetical protein